MIQGCCCIKRVLFHLATHHKVALGTGTHHQHRSTGFKIIFGFLVFILTGSSATYAQPLLQWNTFGNFGTEFSEPSVFNNPNIAPSNLTIGSGCSTLTNANRFGGNGWYDNGDPIPTDLANAIADNEYIAFTVAPNTGYSFTPTSFTFYWDRSVTGPSSVSLRSSVDNFTANLGSVTSLPATLSGPFTIPISGLTKMSGTVTFRLYGYGATTSFSGDGGFDVATNIVNVQLNGIAEPYFVFVGNGSWDIACNWINCLVAPKNIPGGTTVVINHITGGQANVDANINIQQGGQLTINSSKNLNIINAVLTNNGLLDGTGTVTFSGGTTTALSSSGFITAPVILSSKHVFLSGHTNTKEIILLGGSHIFLNEFDLKMNDGALTANSLNFIVTNGLGRLNRLVGSTSILFPVGKSSNSYTPASILNTGALDRFSVRVSVGVSSTGRTTAPVLTGNVDRTWHIEEDAAGGSFADLLLQWNLIDEQGDFNRGESYVSHYQVCPPPDPPSCDAGFYDAVSRSNAGGSDPYTQDRNGVTNFNTPTFIVTSADVVYTFLNTLNNKDWNNAGNWTFDRKPPSISPGVTNIDARVEVIIDPLFGTECIYPGILTVSPGGKLTVKPGKKLTIQ